MSDVTEIKYLTVNRVVKLAPPGPTTVHVTYILIYQYNLLQYFFLIILSQSRILNAGYLLAVWFYL